MIDWKEYNEQPDDGLFEKIQHRLRVRRMWRVGGALATVIVVLAAGLALGNLGSQNDQDVQNTQSVQSTQSVLNNPSTMSTHNNLSNPSNHNTLNTQNNLSTPSNQKTTASKTSDADVALSNEVLPQTTMEVLQVKEPNASVGTKHAEAGDQWSVPTSRRPVAVERPSTAVAQQPEIASQPSDSTQQTKPTTFNILKTPNIIMPDGDEDEIRRFKVTPTETIDNFIIRIFNRRGQQIFVSTDKSFVWEGTADGRRVEQGAYVWVANFRDASGRPRSERGTVTVVR